MNPDNQIKPRSSLPAVLLAGRFLFPFDDDKYSNDPHWRIAARWFVFWGAIIGISYSLVFRGAWRWFGEYHRLRFLPIICVLIADLGWCGYRLLAGVGETAAQRERTAAGTIPVVTLPMLVAILLVGLIKLTMMISLPLGVPLEARDWPADWRNHLGFLYPQVIYRPLILIPIWGRWAMMLAMAVGRVAPGGTNRLKSMARGTRLTIVLLNWVACAGLTVLYCSASANHLARGVVIAMGVMLISYLVSFVLARRTGGQSEATIWTAALAGELAFLSFYVPFASDIYWY